MSKPEKRRVFVCIDLEKTSNTRINAIGLYCGWDDGEVILKNEWWIKSEEKDFEPRCRREFWEGKVPELFKYALANGKDEETQIKDFVSVYDNLHKIAGVQEKDIKLISDNAESDYGGLSAPVLKYCNRQPLRFTIALPEGGTEGAYRSISELEEVPWNLGVYDIVDDYAATIVKHDHHPSNDAENTVIKYMITLEFIKLLKEKYGQKLTEIARESAEKVVNMIRRTRENEIALKKMKRDEKQ